MKNFLIKTGVLAAMALATIITIPTAVLVLAAKGFGEISRLLQDLAEELDGYIDE